MRLSELQPRWIHPNLFIFLCPHCQKDWLTCKNIPMEISEQFDLFTKEFGENWNSIVVPANPDFCWAISSTDFETMTVSPSIDASGSGNWHGNIVNGNIVP